MSKKIFLFLIVLLIATGIIYFYPKKPTSPALQSSTSIPIETASTTPVQSQTAGPFSLPISNALNRITKKPFGIYVSPGHSPVDPERFTGYHTGVDFETTPAEQNIDVPVYAICTGKILISQFGSGYGGMVVESCTLNNNPITVVYGHIRLTSVSTKVGGTINSGSLLANLGTGYSSETDGERKHLHLGIHKSSTPNTSGYVANKSSLVNWIDFEQYLK